MKKFLFSVFVAGLMITFTGCSETGCESNYDTVGVTIDEFSTKTKINISKNSQKCNQPHSNQNCKAEINNIIHGHIDLKLGFMVSCDNQSYKFDLQQTIHKYFPTESYKEESEPSENCYSYWVYDFFSDKHKSEIPLPIDFIKVDTDNNNIWYVFIGDTCYEWDVTNSEYAVNK